MYLKLGNKLHYRMRLVCLLVLFCQEVYSLSASTWCFSDDPSSFANTSNHCTRNSTLENKIAMENFTGNDTAANILIHFSSSSYSILDVIVFKGQTSVTLKSGSSIEKRADLWCQNGSAGFWFDHVKEIQISGLNFRKCTFSPLDFFSSICLSNCENIHLTDVTIEGSYGIGLSLINSSGSISVENSSISNNCYDPDSDTVSGGILISSSGISNAAYNFKNCTVSNNNVTYDSAYSDIIFERENAVSLSPYKGGGGMKAHFYAESEFIELKVTNCLFFNNSAIYGGGLEFFAQEESSSIQVIIEDSNFTSNFGLDKGGGANLGFTPDNDINMAKNISVKFNRCNFISNVARLGGGVYMYSTPAANDCNSEEMPTTFVFADCQWLQNRAFLGSAVFVIRSKISYWLKIGDQIPAPVFRNCWFENNSERDQCNEKQPKYLGKGALYASTVVVNLQGEVSFISNSGSSIFLDSALLNISKDSNITFERNTGYSGGAVMLVGYSSIEIHNNTCVLFDSNTAATVGGAIFQDRYTDPVTLGYQECFIGHTERVTSLNVTIRFVNNSIIGYNRSNSSGVQGLSIFISSLHPCSAKLNLNNSAQFLKATFHVDFEDYMEENEVSTLGHNITKTSDTPSNFFPGRETDLKIDVRDNINSSVMGNLYSVTMNNNNCINIHPDYIHILNNKIKLRGKPGSCGVLKVVLVNRPHFELSLPVHLIDCPPGYLLDENDTCVCSADTQDSYLGIHRCNFSTFHAILLQGHWAGYNNNMSEDNFRTSHCPFGFCQKKELHLPHTFSEMDETICTINRHGKVCSLCANNTALYYRTSDCKSNRLCTFGIFFYLLVEILPVTVFFLVIILYDFKLTSGVLYGFLFYVQIFDALQIHSSNFNDYSKFIKALLIALQFIFGIFSLEFFLLPQISFCLFEGAHFLHHFMFEYCTILYSLLLIIITIFVINSRCNAYLKMITGRQLYTKNSVVHGLSSFLVICYARCTKISLNILNQIGLFGKSGKLQERVVYYHGEFGYLQKDHWPYAAVAIAALLLMTFLPVILLLLYPASYQVFSFLRIQESKVPTLLCKVFPLEKIKPFFDSFQSTFKDKHRYFAGIFFLHRFTILLLFNASNKYVIFYFVLEIQLVLSLLLHAIFQPHKDNRHNCIDVSIFALLAILNSITICNYLLATNQMDYKDELTILSTVQVLLSYIPFVVILGCFSTKLARKLMKHCSNAQQDTHANKIVMNLLESLDENYHDDKEASYSKYS